MLPVIRVLEGDVDAISRGLADKVAEAPQFFHNTPLVIDVEALRGGAGSLNLALLLGMLRGKGLIPVGISGGDEAQNEMAATMELAVLSGGGVRQRRPAPRPERTAQGLPGRLVDQPVRSGQRVYARGGDLVVTGAVSSGAELLADGNIHVYGALRGRALAGVKGERGARVFCQALDAELVSVAGIYRVSEDIDEPLRGRSVQVYLREDSLIVQAL